jgi:hypothetical protein
MAQQLVQRVAGAPAAAAMLRRGERRGVAVRPRQRRRWRLRLQRIYGRRRWRRRLDGAARRRGRGAAPAAVCNRVAARRCGRRARDGAGASSGQCGRDRRCAVSLQRPLAHNQLGLQQRAQLQDGVRIAARNTRRDCAHAEHRRQRQATHSVRPASRASVLPQACGALPCAAAPRKGNAPAAAPPGSSKPALLSSALSASARPGSAAPVAEANANERRGLQRPGKHKHTPVHTPQPRPRARTHRPVRARPPPARAARRRPPGQRGRACACTPRAAARSATSAAAAPGRRARTHEQQLPRQPSDEGRVSAQRRTTVQMSECTHVCVERGGAVGSAHAGAQLARARRMHTTGQRQRRASCAAARERRACFVSQTPLSRRFSPRKHIAGVVASRRTPARARPLTAAPPRRSSLCLPSFCFRRLLSRLGPRQLRVQMRDALMRKKRALASCSHF